MSANGKLPANVDHERRPMLVMEHTILNAFRSLRWVTQIRVRWKPPAPGSANPLGHFVIVHLYFSPETEQTFANIRAELAVRLKAVPIDVALEEASPDEVRRRFPGFPIILQRDWGWYYAHGYTVPDNAKDIEDRNE